MNELMKIKTDADPVYELAQYIFSHPEVIILVTQKDFVSFLNQLDKALEIKGYGNVMAHDGKIPEPVGSKNKAGSFFPHVFTEFEYAHPFAVSRGLVPEGGAYPVLSSRWAATLHSFVMKNYGGIIIDAGQEHRMVISGTSLRTLYALVTAESLGNLSSCLVLHRKGDIFVQMKKEKDNQCTAFIYDSEGAAAEGRRRLGTKTSNLSLFTHEMIPSEEALKSFSLLGVNRLLVNYLLPDEREYVLRNLELLKTFVLKASGIRKLNEAAEKKPSSAGQIPDDLVIIPGAEGTYVDMWKGLREVPFLFIPLNPEVPVQERKREYRSLLEAPNTIFTQPDGTKVGLVYTDYRAFPVPESAAAIRTPAALEQFFHRDDISALSFNLPLTKKSYQALKDDITSQLPFTYTVYKFFLPRLVGLVTSPDPFAEKGQSHVQLAQAALKNDDPCGAYHHSALAREQGAAMDEYYFTELHALMMLSLNKQISEYLEWYKSKGGKHPMFELYYARALSLSNLPDEAVKLVRKYLSDKKIGAIAWLENGRAMLIAGKLTEAVSSFDNCLKADPGNLEALMGKGIALRNLGYSPGDREILTRARQCFEKVAALEGYSTPEACFHLGTICLALGDFQTGEILTRKSLDLRDTGIGRRNLILFLHGQGKVEDAYEEYLFLRKYSPPHAEGLEKYFS